MEAPTDVPPEPASVGRRSRVARGLLRAFDICPFRPEADAMRRGTLELKECSVAVTAVSVVLTVVSADGKTYTVTMPRQMGESLAAEMTLGLHSLAASKLGAAKRPRTAKGKRRVVAPT